MGGYTVEERLDWRRWVTPKPLEVKPIHRWYIFPHSFTSELVHQLMDDWGLGSTDLLLDPFAGAGTTLLAAKEKGLSAKGYDLSPLAVLASGVKIEDHDVNELETAWWKLKARIERHSSNGAVRQYPPLVCRALPRKVLAAFENVDRDIAEFVEPGTVRNFFRLALLSLIPMFSRAVATGGWLRWVEHGKGVDCLPVSFNERVGMMMEDVRKADFFHEGVWTVTKADARSIPATSDQFTAVITSPPYPNRHDYTRVFGVELMFGFLDWEATRELRRQSFHSHPESRPKRQGTDGYRQPPRLTKLLERVRETAKDSRIPNMIEGYFLDTFMSLREVRRLCRDNARIGWVVGNAQYCGVALPVDELTVEVGEQAGLVCEKVLVARYRGNSAQQMGQYGRNPSRESVVILRT